GAGNVQTEFTGPGDPNIPIVQAVFQPAVNAGILQVWCVGNDGLAQPWDQAGRPYWIPSFQPSWLAVVNIAIDGNGNPAGLSTAGNEPSNACGVAAQWCRGAPGDVMIPTPNVPGTVFQGEGFGSSFATAVVTGVAAQVFQAFPWMTAANVSDTLLTTATPLGGSAPNATYGWGMVNAAEAVHGPAQFAFPQFGPFTADIPAGVSSTFSNAISGRGGLKLTGPGTLVLSGADVYQGGSEIAAGTLNVLGSVNSKVTVDSAGTLAGTGVVSADVMNYGTVASVGTSAGQGLTIGGNLTNGSSSTMAVALGNPLQVRGTASVAGTMNVLGAPGGYLVKSNETLLNAGVVSGTFGHLAIASGVFYTGTLTYTSTQVGVALTQANMQAAAERVIPLATAQAITAAGHVQAALDVSNPWFASGRLAGHEAWFQAAGQFLAAPGAANALASLNSLSGEIYATGRAMEAEQSFAADSAIANRELTLSHETGPGLWVQVLGADGTLARAGYDAATYRSGGTLAGVDGAIVASLTAGLAAGRTRANVEMRGLGGRISSRQDLVAAYATWKPGADWYVSARFSDASASDDVQRDVLLATALTHLSAERSDHLMLATLEGGRSIALGGTTLTPYASMEDLHIRQPGFTEQGSAMGLAAPSQTHDATLGTIGMRYDIGFDWSLGRSFLEGNAAWRHALGGADLGMHARFAGVPDTVFVAEGQNLPRNLGVVGVRLNTQVNQRWSWFVDADYQVGNAGTHQVEADAGLRVRF
ncbi:MAG: autotransporter domain-containing protein, partial [Rhodanobacter sp.]